MSATEKMARFVAETRLESMPENVVKEAKRAFLDTVGVALAGTSEPAPRTVIEYVRNMASTPQATVMGADLRTSSPWAALANGVMGHALDFDDSNWDLGGHASVVVLPAVLAQAEVEGASGRETIEAFIIGHEVASKLGAGMNMALYDNGWHPTSVAGAMGASAAAAHLMGLDVERTRLALGCAASHASGIRANFGTMTKPLHAGLAAEAGVRAAGLAAAGLTANPGVLDAAAGYCECFCGSGGYRIEDITGRLGRPFTFESPGNNLKPYPCCMSAHTSVDALRDLMAEEGFSAEDVEKIEVGLVAPGAKNLSYHDPKTALQGKFSGEYCLARVLLDGWLKLSSFTDEAVNEPSVRALMKKIDVRVTDEIEHQEGTTRPAIVSVRTRDGRTWKKRVDRSRGNAELPLSREDLHTKFRDCAGKRLGPEQLEEVIARLDTLEKEKDLRSLISLLG